MTKLKEIATRLAAIRTEIETRGAEITETDLSGLETEVTNLTAERAALEQQERRTMMLENIASGSAQGITVRSFADPSEPAPAIAQRIADPLDTTEYRNAFMEFVCRGTQIPAELRAGQVTGTSDVGAVIPTTTLNEIIKKLDSYGNIYAKVRKLNIQGGVRVPILSIKPTAAWIGETQASEDQKIKANEYVTFNYYGLECKIAQTLLASVVTYEAFQREFVPLSTEAVIKALEKSIFTGTGSGQSLGILIDSRVPETNKITLSSSEVTEWSSWKKKVFGKMKKAYRNGIFAMAQGTFDGYIDGMVDTTGQPIGRVNYGIGSEEKYRFGGKTVETVEDDIIAAYDEAAEGDVIAVFFNPSDYAINSNMTMNVVKWTDHDENTVKNKCLLICDGKLLDANGVIIVKKGA